MNPWVFIRKCPAGGCDEAVTVEIGRNGPTVTLTAFGCLHVEETGWYDGELWDDFESRMNEEPFEDS